MSKRKKTTQSNAIPDQPKKTRLSKALGAASLTRPNAETPAPTYFDFDPDAAAVPPPAPMMDIAPLADSAPVTEDPFDFAPPSSSLPMQDPAFLQDLMQAALPAHLLEAPETTNPPAPTFQGPPIFRTAPGFPAVPTPNQASAVDAVTPEAPPAVLMESLTLVDFKPPTNVFEEPVMAAPASETAPTEAAPALRRRKTRMTLVQEFDITKLVAETETQSQKVIPIETVDDFNAAMHYFTGQAEGRTYTAELRFRASYTPIQDMKVTSEPETAPTTEDNWIVAENVFAPTASEAPRVASPANSGFNMLDLIDESYRTIQANPTFSQARQGQAGLSVDWSQPIAKLPDVQHGLMGGMIGNTKGTGAQYKNHWNKR